MTRRSLKVLDAAVLQRRSVVVLELDAPNPLVGIAPGMPIELVFTDGSRQQVELKSIGFASSTPDHAHVIVSHQIQDGAPAIERIDFDEVPPAPRPKSR